MSAAVTRLADGVKGAPVALIRAAKRRPADRIDIAMIGLAVVAVFLLIYLHLDVFDAEPETVSAIKWVDRGICLVFLGEFLFRWQQRAWSWQFPLRHFYDVIGMLPFPFAIIRAFRLIRIVVILVRWVWTADKLYGNQLITNLVSRFAGTIVNIIKRPITIAVLDEVGDVLKAGHYTKNISIALEANQADMERVAVEVVKNDPRAKAIRVVPFHDQLIELVASTTFRMMYQFLADPRTDVLVNDLIRENIDQIRQAVREEAIVPQEQDADLTEHAQSELARVVDEQHEQRRSEIREAHDAAQVSEAAVEAVEQSSEELVESAETVPPEIEDAQAALESAEATPGSDEDPDKSEEVADAK